MTEEEIGDIKRYHDSGDIFRVKVLDIQERNWGNTPGKEYKLELLEVVNSTAKNPPVAGIEFEVWKADNGNYSNWHLLDE